MDISELVGWTPIRLYWQEAKPWIDWCYFGEQRFTEPFFDHSVLNRFQHPFNLLFRHQTPIEKLIELQETKPGLVPNGFIFHMSRCGSTLVSQIMAALPQNIAVSEASIIDSVLRARFQDRSLTWEDRIIWLRSLIGGLAQPRHPQERHFFVKFDSWSILDFPLIHEAFPDVPWIFLYRDPTEVLVSLFKCMGSQGLPGVLEPELFNFDPVEIHEIPLHEYCVRVVSKICEAAIAHHHLGNGKLINYNQLPEVVWTDLLDFFGVVYTESDLELMKNTVQFDAKTPSLTFEKDAIAKQKEATPEIHALVEKYLAKPYAQLEKLRMKT